MNVELQVDDYFVVTRGETLHPSIVGPLVQFDLPPVYNPTYSGLVLQAREIQDTLVVGQVVGRSAVAPSDLAAGSCLVLDLRQVQIETVSKRFAELLRPQPAEAVALGLAAIPAGPAPERSYVQVGREQKESA
jgi:hypothetical protein